MRSWCNPRGEDAGSVTEQMLQIDQMQEQAERRREALRDAEMAKDSFEQGKAKMAELASQEKRLAADIEAMSAR